MDYTLHIQLSSTEGAVIRALGLMERRGYTLKTCSVGEPDGMGRDLDVTVTSTRSGDLLKRQLERLHDVFFVELNLPHRLSHATRAYGPYSGALNEPQNLYF